MEEINYEKLLPALPAEDVVSFACETSGKLRSHYLIYCSERAYVPLEDRMQDAVQVTCTACGAQFYADKIRADGCANSMSCAPFGWMNGWKAVISGDHTRCPHCGQKAKTVHTGNMRSYGGELVDDAWVSVITRIPVEGARDRAALLDWCVRRCVNKQGAVRFEVWPYTAWVVEEKKIVRLMGYRKCLTSLSLLGHWEQRKTFCDEYGKAGPIMPWDKRLLEGTTAENCKLDLYLEGEGLYPVSYLALWRKRPAVENLLVQGCGHIVERWIREETLSAYRKHIPKLPQVNWKENRPAQMLGLTKEEFRQMRLGKWNAEELQAYRLVRDAGISVRLPEDMELLRGLREYECNQILEEAPRADFRRILRYLQKQKSDWHTLRDYWRFAREDGRDLTDGLVRFPRDLKAVHDRQIQERNERLRRQREEQLAQWKAQEEKEKAQQAELFRKRLAELEGFAFRRDGLLIRPCRDEDELRAEGSALHHCVASYAKDHAAGKTAIFFIRRADEPDKPFFTLEFDEKKILVRQNRGLRNCYRTADVTAFEKAWLEWVRTNKKKRRGAA